MINFVEFVKTVNWFDYNCNFNLIITRLVYEYSTKCSFCLYWPFQFELWCYLYSSRVKVYAIIIIGKWTKMFFFSFSFLLRNSTSFTIEFLSYLLYTEKKINGKYVNETRRNTTETRCVGSEWGAEGTNERWIEWSKL